MEQKELPWLAEGRKYIGLAEIPGKAHHPMILRWLGYLKAWWADDETPWCGTFVAHCLKTAGRDVPKHWYRALAYADYGRRLDAPAYGCIAVFGRKGGGHVGFVAGRDKLGNLLVLGGNQGNRVSIAAFAPGRVLAYVWPDKGGIKAAPLAVRYDLPVGSAAFSRSEA